MTEKELELDTCKNDFKTFVGFIFDKVFRRKFHWYAFHQEIAKILLRLPTEKRVIINAPPRLGKTDLTKCYMAWLLLRDPSSTFIYCSYDEALVTRKNREIKDIVTWLAKYFDIPDLKPRGSANGKKEWTNLAGGSVIARGTNSNVTGSGCKTLLVCDDPNKPQDRLSKAILSRRWTVFKSSIRNRIDLPDVPILIIQQRVSTEDISGCLLNDSSEEWKQYLFPAILANGDALCPERLPVEEVNKYKSDPFTYNAQYLQVPFDQVGEMFKKDQLILSSTRPPINSMRLVISVDAAGKGETQNDYNAISVCARSNTTNKFFVLEVLNFHAEISVLLAKIREVRARWGQNVPVLIENKANGMAAIQILRQNSSGILEYTPHGDKVERAIVIKYLFESKDITFTCGGLVWGDIQNQFCFFPNYKHDDIVDSIVQGITWLRRLPLQNAERKETANINRPKFSTFTFGSNGYC